MRKLHTLLTVLGLVCAAAASAQKNVIEEGGIGLTYEELDYIVRNWTPDMREAAARDLGDRLELLNLALSNKRIAAEADKLTPEKDGDVYWQYLLTQRATARKLVVDHYLRNVQLPDMTEVARERFLAQQERYARTPEQRLSSHILFKCAAGDDCDKNEMNEKAQQVLAELESGGDFEALAREHSDDKGSASKGGLYERWLTRYNKQVAPEYIKAVFSIAEPGQHTGVIPSRFGYHIIRLEELKPEHYRSFEEAREDVLSELHEEYHELNAKAFDARYRISDKAFIDGAAMERLFEPYKPAATAAPDAAN